jgi:hypothetical protein
MPWDPRRLVADGIVLRGSAGDRNLQNYLLLVMPMNQYDKERSFKC